MSVTGQSAVADAVAVDIYVTLPGALQPVKLFCRKHLAAIKRFFRIAERLRRPEVPGRGQDRSAQSQSLQPFSQIKGRTSNSKHSAMDAGIRQTCRPSP